MSGYTILKIVCYCTFFFQIQNVPLQLNFNIENLKRGTMTYYKTGFKRAGLPMSQAIILILTIVYCLVHICLKKRDPPQLIHKNNLSDIYLLFYFFTKHIQLQICFLALIQMILRLKMKIIFCFIKQANKFWYSRKFPPFFTIKKSISQTRKDTGKCVLRVYGNPPVQR